MPAPELVISPLTPLIILGWSCDMRQDETPAQSAARWAREWSSLPDVLRRLGVMVATNPRNAFGASDLSRFEVLGSQAA